MLRLLARVEGEDVLPERREGGLRLDRLPVVREHEELDVADEREHRPGRLAEHGARDVVGLGQERVALGHALGGEALHAAEHLLVLELLVGEAHQRLEGDLVAEPVVAAHLQDLGRDEALDQAEHVGVGAALDLGEQAPLVRTEKIDLVHLRDAVRQELPREIELAAADDVAVDVPADALRDFDALGIAPGIGLLLRDLHVMALSR
ncbi:hypothetical protein D3C83_00360 [compost metagenome]